MTQTNSREYPPDELVEKYPLELLKTQKNIDNEMIKKLIEKYETKNSKTSVVGIILLLKEYQPDYWKDLTDPNYSRKSKYYSSEGILVNDRFWSDYKLSPDPK